MRIAYACSSGGMTGCKFCTDFSGEFSDISYSPWGAPKGSGEAFLIIRTDVGQKVVDSAVKKKLIEITEPNPDLSEMKKFLNIFQDREEIGIDNDHFCFSMANCI